MFNLVACLKLYEDIEMVSTTLSGFQMLLQKSMVLFTNQTGLHGCFDTL